ncbi:MAG: hypothetical protein JWN14_4185 [Chthonomonadales bacterium]|nr:hypothetical protein [Chthonomonadales bacterium]
MNYFSVGLTLLVLGAAAPHAIAQVAPDDLPPPTALINLDDAGLLKKGQISEHLDLRAFGGGEDLFYTNLGVHFGLGHNWEAAIRGSSADRTNFAIPGVGVIRHGGNDVELLARYRFLHADPESSKVSVTGLVGVGLPSTPDRTAASVTLGLSASTSFKRRVTLTLNPRAVLLENDVLVGIGIGAQVTLAKGVSLVGDYTPILSGDNTRNTVNGGLMRRDIYGAAFRFSSSDSNVFFDLGYTNGLGSTTGLSLSPGLQGSGAFYFAITARH